jgi:hypothetical protein
MMVLMMITGGAEQEWRMRFRRYKEEVFPFGLGSLRVRLDYYFYHVHALYPILFLLSLGPHSSLSGHIVNSRKLEKLIIILMTWENTN